MRVQRGVPVTFPVPTRRAHADSTDAARHSVGTSSGLHPEDRPYLTDERRPINEQAVYADEQNDDRLYDVRVPTSARRYAAPTTQAPRTVMHVTRHQGPPPIQQTSRAFNPLPLRSRKRLPSLRGEDACTPRCMWESLCSS
jgi:hypothetical protein